jgi:superfamily I DNA and/or RNA helicase
MQGRVVLVGDPKQLPPTVLSKEAAAARLAQSLFERLQRTGVATGALEVQYRMHPAISAFPASFFYAGGLRNGVGEGDKRAAHHTEARTA